MANWRNESGQPLSALSWLEAHHRAKLAERVAFAKSILRTNPKKIVDLGCGPGIWLELLDTYASPECEFVGIDSDLAALHLARTRKRPWSRTVNFERIDIEDETSRIPEADVFLLFNVFPYLRDAVRFLESLRQRVRLGGLVAIRQYDGSLLRFGPMPQASRSQIDQALQASVLGSDQFRHYDLDRVFHAVSSSSFEARIIDFELFRRVTPYPIEFVDYFANSIQWIIEHVSLDARAELQRWYDAHNPASSHAPSYFTEVDLVVCLS